MIFILLFLWWRSLERGRSWTLRARWTSPIAVSILLTRALGGAMFAAILALNQRLVLLVVFEALIEAEHRRAAIRDASINSRPQPVTVERR